MDRRRIVRYSETRRFFGAVSQMNDVNGMNDVSQSQLGKKIDAFVNAVEVATSKKIREIKFSQCGDLTAIINDERYLHENPWLFEDLNSVAEFSDSNKLQEAQKALQEAQKEIGKLIQRSYDMQK